MRDTSFDIEKKMIEMMQKKTPQERALMTSSMHATAREMVIQSILKEQPNLSLNELKQQLFLRFYHNDFDEEAQKHILEHLSSL